MTIIKDLLVYINPSKKDYCEIDNLTSDWKTILSHYMATHYLRCISYEVHNSYFIVVDCLYDDCIDNDTIAVLNKANITIYSIDNIVGCILIKFKNKKTRDLVFEVLKGEIA